jgi:hypothetical protein
MSGRRPRRSIIGLGRDFTERDWGSYEFDHGRSGHGHRVSYRRECSRRFASGEREDDARRSFALGLEDDDDASSHVSFGDLPQDGWVDGPREAPDETVGLPR